MNTIIEYLIINSPYTKEELIVLTIQQLESIAYTYNMPNAPTPDRGWRNL